MHIEHGDGDHHGGQLMEMEITICKRAIPLCACRYFVLLFMRAIYLRRAI